MVDKVRGFEVVSKYINEDGTTDIVLPVKGSSNSAGYDFQSAIDVDIPSIWEIVQEFIDKRSEFVDQKYIDEVNKGNTVSDDIVNFVDTVRSEFSNDEEIKKLFKPTLVPTGIKAYMGSSEFLMLPSRSSLPTKKYLLVSNGVGIIDSDYYNNKDNEGEIYIQVLNFGTTSCHIDKGERLAQGIFLPYLTSDNGNVDTERIGGTGSTGGYTE